MSQITSIIPIHTLQSKGRLLSLQQPVVMGILNINNDSFYAGSRMEGAQQAVDMAGRMIQEGASIIDIGAVSTRPGAPLVDSNTEMDRLLPVVEAIHKAFPQTWISADTYHATTARAASVAGASIINDVSAGIMDPDMLHTVAALQLPYIIMHMQGTPAHMQENPHYNHVVTDLIQFFRERIKLAQTAGINQLILDPGFGFGKTTGHNFSLLRHMRVFQEVFHLPVLAGVSRKSMVNKVAGTTPDTALHATTATHMLALLNGAAILRVHDVKPAIDTIRIFTYYMQTP